MNQTHKHRKDAMNMKTRYKTGLHWLAHLMSAAMLLLFSLGEWAAAGEKGVHVKRVLWTDTPLIIDNETAKTPRRADGLRLSCIPPRVTDLLSTRGARQTKQAGLRLRSPAPQSAVGVVHPSANLYDRDTADFKNGKWILANLATIKSCDPDCPPKVTRGINPALRSKNNPV
jgi:hypothetical protein